MGNDMPEIKMGVKPMTASRAIIGRIDWRRCETCIHCPPDTGGCDVPEDEWEEGVHIEYDSVICESYSRIKKKESK